jgi:hypothetical protein
MRVKCDSWYKTSAWYGKSTESWIGTKNVVFNATTFFSKSVKDVYNVQGTWHSPNTLPTIIHGKDCRIITSKVSTTTWGCARQFCRSTPGNGHHLIYPVWFFFMLSSFIVMITHVFLSWLVCFRKLPWTHMNRHSIPLPQLLLANRKNSKYILSNIHKCR